MADGRRPSLGPFGVTGGTWGCVGNLGIQTYEPAWGHLRLPETTWGYPWPRAILGYRPMNLPEATWGYPGLLENKPDHKESSNSDFWVYMKLLVATWGYLRLPGATTWHDMIETWHNMTWHDSDMAWHGSDVTMTWHAMTGLDMTATWHDMTW